MNTVEEHQSICAIKRAARARGKDPIETARTTVGACYATFDMSRRQILRRLLASLDVEIIRGRLRAEQAEIQAVLVPRWQGGGFHLLVDPALTPEQRDALTSIPPPDQASFKSLVRLLRVAHEVGHALFYEEESGRNVRSARPDSVEEQFCNEFAWQLCAPDPTDRWLRAAVFEGKTTAFRRRP